MRGDSKLRAPTFAVKKRGQETKLWMIDESSRSAIQTNISGPYYNRADLRHADYEFVDMYTKATEAQVVSKPTQACSSIRARIIFVVARQV